LKLEIDSLCGFLGPMVSFYFDESNDKVK